jgi:hypothetical protein
MPALRPRLARAVLLLAALAVGACAPTLPDLPETVVLARPDIPEVPTSPSAESEAARAYYAKVQSDLLARGLLRTDGGSQDAVFTDRMLAENFIRIALFDEYTQSSQGLVAQATESRLRRWDQPIRVGLRFGASVPEDRQATDRARIASFLARLSQVSGHPIRLSDASPNFFVYIVNEDERRALGPVIEANLPGLSPSEIAGITNMPRSTYCLVYAMSAGNGSTYTRAMAVIRSEHPDLMRLSCIHEEVTQGLGLANDSPAARPSIFNDDEEFALLTPMDELMLKMLYSPRLSPGMTEAEARPIVESLATALMGGES